MEPAATTSLKAHWTLDPEVTFLNHGSFGACPTPVIAAQQELRDRLEREPVLLMARELEGLYDGVRTDLAAFLVAEPEDVVFVPNATTAVNAVLRSMALAPGDEILVTDHGYNACRNAVEFVTERAGARVAVAEVPFPVHSPDEVVAAVLAAATDATRLAVIDHITSPTGLVLPIARIVAELRERGIETLVDGAHGPGMVALDLSALGAGYYTGNCHKWLCTPKGSAFLHVRRELQAPVRPVVISHGANARRTDRSRFLVEFDWPGTVDPTPVLAIPTALAFMGSLLPGGWDEVRDRNRALALEARTILMQALGLPAPAPEEMIGALAALPLKGATTERASPFAVDPLQTALFERYKIEVPIYLWPAPPLRLLRISAQLYNERADYAKLADALRELSGEFTVV